MSRLKTAQSLTLALFVGTFFLIFGVFAEDFSKTSPQDQNHPVLSVVPSAPPTNAPPTPTIPSSSLNPATNATVPAPPSEPVSKTNIAPVPVVPPPDLPPNTNAAVPPAPSSEPIPTTNLAPVPVVPPPDLPPNTNATVPPAPSSEPVPTTNLAPVPVVPPPNLPPNTNATVPLAPSSEPVPTTNLAPVPVVPPPDLLPNTNVSSLPSDKTVAPTYKVAPPSDWVKPMDPEPLIPEPPGQVEDGVEYLIVDTQEKVEPREIFSHDTTRIVNEHGIQNGSEFRVSFDPSYQTLTLHWLKVKRNGVWQDRLSTEKIQMLQREENLDSQLLDGRYSAVCNLQDIRVGDVIDYAYTICGDNPVYEGRYSTNFDTTWGSPLRLLNMQIFTNANHPLTYKSYAYPMEPTHIRHPDGTEELVWRKEKIPAFSAEKNTPDWYDTYGWVQVTEYSSWKEVADWALSIYPLNDPLSPELKAKVNEIAAKYPQAEDRVVAVMELVQSDVRYLGIEMGPSSCKPTPPSLVYQHRFGDCKDKSLLCVALLRALQVDADPVLVNTDYRQELAHFLPSPLDFNHAILRVTIDNHSYWLDATRTGQHGKLKNFYVTNYQLGLVLKSGETSLVPMQSSPESLPHDEIHEIYTTSSVDKPVDFQIHSIFRGLSAESYRNDFAENSIEKTQKQYLDYYADHFTQIKVAKPLRFQDFPQDNRFEIWEDYTIDHLWTKKDASSSKWTLSIKCFVMDDEVSFQPSPQRKAPYQQKYPLDKTEDIEVHLWEDWNLTPSNTHITTPNFTFSNVSSLDKSVLYFNYTYKNLTPFVPLDQMTDYHDQLKKVWNETGETITWTLPQPVPPKPIPKPEPFQLNWMGVLIAFFMFSITGYICWRFYQLPRPMPPLVLSQEIAQFQGLRGWLIWIMIMLLLRILYLPYFIIFTFSAIWNSATWNSLTVFGQTAYHPLWAPLLLLELCVNIVLWNLCVLGFILLIQKRALFPKVAISILALSSIFAVLDESLIPLIPALSSSDVTKDHTDLYRAIAQTCIWIPYFVVSRRVKATFRF